MEMCELVFCLSVFDKEGGRGDGGGGGSKC